MTTVTTEKLIYSRTRLGTLGDLESRLRAVVLPGLLSALSDDDGWFVLETARAHGMEQQFYLADGVDADVLSYAIETAEALSL